MRFKIITSVWNSAQWFEGCAASILSQTEPYDVFIIDDGSTDGTAEMVECISRRNGWSWRLNVTNFGAAYSQWVAIQGADDRDEDVFVFLDGDDQLTGDALTKLKPYYEDDTLLTYGQYRSEPFSPTCSLAGPYPQDVIDRRSYREYTALGHGVPWNHLRTVRAGLLNQLNVTDFQDANGNFYQAGVDAAVMFPCLELAGENFKFIPEVLYVYNSENPLSDWRRQPREGDRCAAHILNRPPKVTVR